MHYLAHCVATSAGQKLILEERIDVMIDKAIKRMCHMKTMKEVVFKIRHASVANEPLKQIDSPASQVADVLQNELLDVGPPLFWKAARRIVPSPRLLQ
jgi:hypothetical protein